MAKQEKYYVNLVGGSVTAKTRKGTKQAKGKKGGRKDSAPPPKGGR